MNGRGASERKARFSLAIPADVYLSYYQRAAEAVVVQAYDGRTLQFPAGILQRFVTHDGVYGEFEIEFDARHKLVAIRRIGE